MQRDGEFLGIYVRAEELFLQKLRELSMPDTPSGQHLSPKQWPLSIPFVNAAITSYDLYQVEDVLTSKETLLQKSLLHKTQQCLKYSISLYCWSW